MADNDQWLHDADRLDIPGERLRGDDQFFWLKLNRRGDYRFKWWDSSGGSPRLAGSLRNVKSIKITTER